jgi:adenylate kinase family enzyme
MPTNFNLSSYSRIMIAGCCGSGKSTLSRSLGKLTQLPLIHLDQEYWQAGWEEPSAEDWRSKVASLVTRDKWIMDGNYSGTWDLRLPRAELVIYLRYPLLLVLYRAVKRIITNYGRVREDMAQGCPERFSLAFFHFILVCHFRSSHAHLQQLQNLEPPQTLLVFRSPKALNNWINGIRN